MWKIIVLPDYVAMKWNRIGSRYCLLQETSNISHNYYFCEIKYQIWWRSVLKCLHTFYRECARLQIVCVHLLTDLHEIKNFHKIVIDHHIKFHPSFCYWDICKTILIFWIFWFSMCFPYFHIFAPQKSQEVDNYWMFMIFFGN